MEWETLSRYGIPVARFERVSTLAEAEAFRASLDGAATCLKADTNLHKSALGLVELDLRSAGALRAAWERLERNAERAGLARRFLVQEVVPAGPELFAGVLRDASFGHVLAAGIGGTLIEAIGRRALRLLPIDAAGAHALVRELRVDHAAAESFERVLVAVSELVGDHPEIRELDLNPVILGPAGAVVVDLRAFTEDEPVAYAPARPDAAAAIARLMAPAAVAVVGASADPAKPGGRALRYLAELAPHVRRHPVSVRGGEIDGVPVLERVADLPDGIDAAVIATPADSVPAVVRDLGARGVPAAVVFASGFREAGAPERERAVADAASAAGVRLCGVNCMGLIGDAPLTFTQALMGERRAGGVSFLTQSGAIGGSLLLRAWASGLGTARFISVGNETDLTVADYLDFLAGDDATTTIGLFLEGVADGRRLLGSIAAARAAGKRVVVLRTGASEAAMAAVLTHTGALAGADDVYRQALRDSGAVLVDDVPTLIGICQALEWQPASAGRRVAVLSTSGGGCSLVADHLARLGLEVPELEPEVQQRLRGVLPAYAPTRNPLDTTGNIASDSSLVGRMLEHVLASERIDAVVVAISALIGDTAMAIAESVTEHAATTGKPIVVGCMLPETAVADQFAHLRAHRVPVYDSVALACSAIQALASLDDPSRDAQERSMSEVTLAAGTEFAPYRWVVEEGQVEQFRRALHVEGTPPGDNGHVPISYSVACGLWGISHSELLAEVGLDTRFVVHGEQEFEIHAPLVIGAEYRVRHRVADVQVKQGRRGGRMTVVTIETEIEDEAGALSVRERHTSIQTER